MDSCDEILICPPDKIQSNMILESSSYDKSLIIKRSVPLSLISALLHTPLQPRLPNEDLSNSLEQECRQKEVLEKFMVKCSGRDLNPSLRLERPK